MSTSLFDVGLQMFARRRIVGRVTLGMRLSRRALMYARGGSVFWRGVVAVAYGRRMLKQFFGKQPEPIGIYRLGANQFLSVVTAVPLSRREQRRTGITRAVLQRRAEADIQAMQRGS